MKFLQFYFFNLFHLCHLIFIVISLLYLCVIQTDVDIFIGHYIASHHSINIRNKQSTESWHRCDWRKCSCHNWTTCSTCDTTMATATFRWWSSERWTTTSFCNGITKSIQKSHIIGLCYTNNVRTKYPLSCQSHVFTRRKYFGFNRPFSVWWKSWTEKSSMNETNICHHAKTHKENIYDKTLDTAHLLMDCCWSLRQKQECTMFFVSALRLVLS